MRRIAVVTDSTCDLPEQLVDSLGLRVVPLTVAFGNEDFVAGVTLGTAEFFDKLRASGPPPTTSQPTRVWFDEAYADCADDGFDGVVSLHCSAALSGTAAVAREAASTAPLPVEVVDSRLVGGALGLAVLAAHRAAEAGGRGDEVVAAAEQVRAATTSLIVVDTLEFLRRGGRLTGAQALVGTALRVKPVLHLTDDGRIELRERTRTWSRALDRLAALVVDAAQQGLVDVAVVHAVAPERAEQLWDLISPLLRVRHRLDGEIGPVVGAHVGPGAVGVAVARVPEDG